MNINLFIRALESFQLPVFDNPHSVLINDKKYFPLYIILYANKGMVGDAIRSFTKEPYSHSSISFDTSMTNIYTFGQRVILSTGGGQNNNEKTITKKLGASIESFTKSIDKFSYPSFAKVAIYATYFSENNMNSIKDYISTIFSNPDNYSYNSTGLVKYALGKSSESETRMFCSQFVANILKIGGIKLEKESSLYSPYSLIKSENIIDVWTGFIGNYDKRIVDRRMKNISNNVMRLGLVNE